MSGPIAHIDPATIAAALDANHIAFRLSLSRLPGAVVHDGPGSLWVDSGIADALYNSVVRARFSPEGIDTQIESVLSHFRRHSSPVSWYVGPTTTPAYLGRYLQAHGMIHQSHDDEPGMAIEIDRVSEQDPPTGLTIETVNGPAGLRDWVSVWLFAVPEDRRLGHVDVLRRKGLGDAPWRYYLGRLGGMPVATSMIFVGEGVAAVHQVNTLPGFRGRGIGSAMTRWALNGAVAMGYRVAVLTASPLGARIYRQIGFREYCRLRQYRWDPSPEAAAS